MRQWTLFGALVVMLVTLQYKLWFGDTGYQQNQSLKQQLAQQLEQNRQQAQKNAALGAEIASLKQDLDAIEAEARYDLGLVKDHERFYQFIDHTAITQR